MAQSDQSPLSTFLSQLAELAHRLIVSLAVFAAEFAFFFFFTIRRWDLGDFALYYPYPSFYESLATQFFHALVDHFVHKKFTLINIGPFDLLASTVYAAAFLAAIFSVPVWAYEIGAFVSPGLTSKEKRIIRALALPAALLFVLGALFAYEVLLPVLFDVMYQLTVSLGVEPTMSVRSFITIVVAYMAATGLSFELPVFMVALSYVGLVSYESWKAGWRWAIVACFFIALLISPGTTGGLMETVIGLTLSLLYFVGLLVVRLISGKGGRPTSENETRKS